MYFVCILTSPQQRAWRCGDTWIMCGSHNTRPTCGIRPKYILIHDQIHVSVRGVSSPNWGGIITIPRTLDPELASRRSNGRCAGPEPHRSSPRSPAASARVRLLYFSTFLILFSPCRIAARWRWRDARTTRPDAMARLQRLFIRCHAVWQIYVTQ